ncbi:MAG: protein kinase domain-containing protein, partial [Pirellula sp.]
QNSGVSGTPLYMSPESIQTPDAVDGRSDLYALGAVGYFLLTGQTVFQARTLSELCQQHITAVPELPSQRLGRPISSGLEDALMSCLEKNRAKRPQTARALSKMLEAIELTDSWTSDEAEAWWGRHERKVSKSLPSATLSTSNAPAATPPTASSGFDQTIGER